MIDSQLIGVIGIGGVALVIFLVLASKAYKTLRTDNVSMVGVQSDASRITSLLAENKALSDELREERRLARQLAQDKSDLSGRISALESKLDMCLAIMRVIAMENQNVLSAPMQAMLGELLAETEGGAACPVPN